MTFQPEEEVIVEVTGERDRVIQVLNLLVGVNQESWRKITKRRNSTDYRGRACYRVKLHRADAPLPPPPIAPNYPEGGASGGMTWADLPDF